MSTNRQYGVEVMYFNFLVWKRLLPQKDGARPSGCLQTQPEKQNVMQQKNSGNLTVPEFFIIDVLLD